MLKGVRESDGKGRGGREGMRRYSELLVMYRYAVYNTIQSNLFQLSYMSIIIIIPFFFINETSKRICRKLNKLIRDIPSE